MTPNVLTVDRGADERTLPSFRPSPTLIVGFRRAIRNASETAIHRTLSLLDRTTNNTLYYIERNDLPACRECNADIEQYLGGVTGLPIIEALFVVYNLSPKRRSDGHGRGRGREDTERSGSREKKLSKE